MRRVDLALHLRELHEQLLELIEVRVCRHLLPAILERLDFAVEPLARAASALIRGSALFASKAT